MTRGTPTVVTSASIASETEYPRLRGVLHQYAFVASLLAAAVLVELASGPTEMVAVSVFAVALSLMFGTSALYHRVRWRPELRRRIRCADHAAVYLLIAATYTPLGLLVLEGAWRVPLLAVVWSGSIAAMLLKLLWWDAPRWLAAVAGLALGWLGVLVFPQVVAAAGPVAASLLAAGGVLYTAGAVVYGVGRPNPAPEVFGFHEIFHALVIAAAACQYAAVTSFVLGN